MICKNCGHKIEIYSAGLLHFGCVLVCQTGFDCVCSKPEKDTSQ